jgi:hypothetical protein
MKSFMKFLLLLLTVSIGYSQSFTLGPSAVGGGGGTSSGGSFSVSGTIGKPDAGQMSGGSFSLAGGFGAVVSAVQTIGAPFLAVTRSENTVTLSWLSSSASGFVLQQNSAGLENPAAWVVSPAKVVEDGTRKSATISVPNGFLFFRLKK